MAYDVAVIIPAFNAELFLPEALASVASQTVPPAEVVVVDDGSTDETALKAEEWKSVLPLQVLRQSNQGAALARRVALDVTSAPLIALLDADDVWLPNHLASLCEAYEKHPGIISANAIRWRPDQPGSVVRQATRLPVPAVALQRTEILKRNFVFISALFSRHDYGLVAGFRDGAGAEDWDLWIQMVRLGVPVYGLTEPTCLYRLGAGSTTERPDIFEQYVETLERAKRESADPLELPVLNRSLRRYRCRLHLRRAEQAAAEADNATARREARLAFGGSPVIAMEAGVILVAPSIGLRLQQVVARSRWG